MEDGDAPIVTESAGVGVGNGVGSGVGVGGGGTDGGGSFVGSCTRIVETEITSPARAVSVALEVPAHDADACPVLSVVR